MKILTILIYIAFIAGIGCLIAFNIIGADVTADGQVIEPFFLIPVGWLLIFAGIIMTIVRFVFNRK